MSDATYVLETREVMIRFGGLTAVNNFNIGVPQGSIVGLIGPNGAGKTTCFNIITGFYKPTKGEVFLEGRPITGLPPHKVCEAGIARTFQNIRLFYNETVLQNVMIGGFVRQKSPWWMAPLMIPSCTREEKELREQAMELLKSVGLDMVDANLLSVAVPHGLLPPDDPIMQRTVARIERELHVPHSGVHRHLADVYYGGGSWVLLALWLAWYYLEIGSPQRAADLITWSEAQADAGGHMPEQVNTAMLAPEFYQEWVERRGPIANPLLWTHAKYLIVQTIRSRL